MAAMDPKKLLELLPRFDRERPFRYLGRRLVQAMAEAARANLLTGRRTAPGRYLVIRLVADAEEKESWEEQFAESRAALRGEMEREAVAREIELRSPPEADLLLLTDSEVERLAGEPETSPDLLAAVGDPEALPALLARLREERELILPRRARAVTVETEPPEAQVYLDDRPAGVTPCRLDDVPEGEHRLLLVRPGHLPLEETIRIPPGAGGGPLLFRFVLAPEPPMGRLEVQTFPPDARVTIGGETRDAPALWRLPAGPVEIRVEREEFDPVTLVEEVPPTGDGAPRRVQVRLRYSGPGRDEVVGRLIVYDPESAVREPPSAPPPVDAPEEPADPWTGRAIAEFFGRMDAEEPEPAGGPGVDAVPPAPPEPRILAEVPLRRGVLILGREDPGGLRPDIRLFDAENSVSRGCHAWLHVYADRATGADYNTFLIGNNSPAGIRVDGELVMGTRRLSDGSEIAIGNFRMRLRTELPAPRVEVDL